MASNKITSLPGLDNSSPSIQFFNVVRVEQKDPRSPYTYNEEEIVIVREWIESLQQLCLQLQMSNIGVISPYQWQVKKLKEYLTSNIKDGEKIGVGSVENFQGAEKKVTVLSCVHSNPVDLEKAGSGF